MSSALLAPRCLLRNPPPKPPKPVSEACLGGLWTSDCVVCDRMYLHKFQLQIHQLCKPSYCVKKK